MQRKYSEGSAASKIAVVRLLLKSGAGVNSKDDIWGSVLQWATADMNYDLVNILVSQACDVNSPGKFGGSHPLMAAAATGNTTIFKLLLKLGARVEGRGGIAENLLRTASYLGRDETVAEILDRGYDVNARDEPYGDALTLAVQGGHSKIAENLIARGADVKIKSEKYGTALHFAAT
jgi:serine/threonine-protein phosphatase 6 regulatory ankyrin repeat subunit B